MGDDSSKKVKQVIPLCDGISFGTSDGYFGPVYQARGIVAVPYVNICFSLTCEWNDVCYVDRCVLYARDVIDFKCDRDMTPPSIDYCEDIYVIGGERVTNGVQWIEAEFKSKNAFLILPENSVISGSSFMRSYGIDDFRAEELREFIDGHVFLDLIWESHLQFGRLPMEPA